MKGKLSFFLILGALLPAFAQPGVPGLCQESGQGSPAPIPSTKQNGVKGSASVIDVGADLLLAPNRQPNKPSLPLSSLASSGVGLTVKRYDVLLKDRRGILIQVSNQTDRPLLFAGNLAKARAGAIQYSAVPVSEIEQSQCPKDTLKRTFKSDLKATVTAAVSIGAVQTIADEKMASRSIADRYGCDESRRQAELSSFEQRILWPGDSSEGVIYFNTENSLSEAHLELPVSAFYDKSDCAVVTN